MPDATLKISDPVSAIVEAASNVVVAILNATSETRATMSPEAKNEQDRINFQIYWDWRDILQGFGIVGEPRPWPPK